MPVVTNQPLRQIQQRYCLMALMMAAVFAAMLLAVGFRPLGKGLVLGTLFSVLNFTTMAMLLPLQLNHRRNKSMLIAFGSILLRYGLMAIPLIVALKSSQFALPTVVIGLFGVQIIILGDHFWARLRDSFEARH